MATNLTQLLPIRYANMRRPQKPHIYIQDILLHMAAIASFSAHDKIRTADIASFSVAHENGHCQWTSRPLKPICKLPQFVFWSYMKTDSVNRLAEPENMYTPGFKAPLRILNKTT